MTTDRKPDFGLRSVKGFPHKDWVHCGVEDLGDLDGSCQVCGTGIRYVHYLEHEDWDDTIGVGCVCAEDLTQDKVTPKARETSAKARVGRNRRWLAKEWTPSQKGFTLKALGFRMTVFRITKAPYEGMWGYFVGDIRGGKPCRTLDGAKIACRDLVEELREDRS